MATLPSGTGNIFAKGSTLVESTKAYIDLRLNPLATPLEIRAAQTALVGAALSIAEDFTKGNFNNAAKLGGGAAALGGLAINAVQLNDAIDALAAASASGDEAAIFTAQRELADKVAATSASVGGIIMAIPGGQVLGGAIWLGGSAVQQIAKSDTVAEGVRDISNLLGDIGNSNLQPLQNVAVNDNLSYTVTGTTTTVGTGPSAEVHQPVTQVSTFKDPVTNASMEVRIQGTLVDGKFVADGTTPFVKATSPTGIVYFPGHVDLATATPPDIGITDNLSPSGNAAYEQYRRDEITQQNTTAPNGQPYGTTTQTAPNASETWSTTTTSGVDARTQEVRNASSTTRIVTLIDKATGQPVSEIVYENLHSANNPNAPDSFNIVSIFDAKTGVRQSLNHSTGQMETVQGGAPDRAPFNPLPNSGTADNSFTIRPGDSLWKIGKTLGLSDSETARFVAETQANARAAGSDGNVDDLRVGNTVAIPDWAKDKLAAYREASINGLDLPPPINPTSNGVDGSDAHFNNHPAPDGSTPTTELKPDLTQEQSDALLASLGLKPTATSPAGVQYADAGNTTGNGGVVSDAGGGGSSVVAGGSASNQPLAPADIAQTATQTIANSVTTAPNPNNYAAYLSGAGSSLSPKQQDALAAQLDALGLGGAEGAGALSFYPLPGGGVLIGNADGDIVGELGVAPDGELHLQSNAINAADGTTTTVDTHIAPNGQATSYSPYQLGQVNAALNLIQGLDGLQHWDKMDDLGHFSSLLGLSNSINTLSNGALGNLGALNTFSGYVGLAQNLENGNVLSTLSSIDGISGNQVIDGALNNALGSTGVPYLGIATALNDFEHHPGQSIGSLVGMYFGPLGSAIGGMIGGLLDAAGVFGDNRPPPPEGATHFEWDANGNIQIKLDFNQSGGGAIAQSTAQSVQGLLQSIVQSINDQTPDTSDNVAINPYLLPRVGFSQAGGAWIEMTTPDGGSYREMIQGNNLAQRLFEILTENGGIAPAWQVQTQLGHMQQLLDQGAGQGEIAAQLGAGAGGHAYHGNQAYAIEGNATESADFKTQSFGALVVHLNTDAVQASTQALQDLQDQQAQDRVATSELYRDTEGDGYFEKTQWVSATDAHGNLHTVNAGQIRYSFDSYSRMFNKGQRHIFLEASNSSAWRMHG